MSLLSLKLIAGNSWTWSETFPGYSPDHFSASVYFKKPNQTPVKISGTSSDQSYVWSVKPSESSAILPGEYTCFYRITKTDFAVDIPIGKVTVYPDLTLQKSDPRTQDEIDLDNAKAAYSRLISREADEIDFNGKKIKYTNRKELKAIITKLENKLGVSKPTPRILEQY